MFYENRMHGLPQLADPLAVNDPHLQNAARPTLGEIIVDDTFDISRTKRVQIQNAADGKFDRLPAVVSVVAVVHASHVNGLFNDNPIAGLGNAACKSGA